jgi:hypothetical protein
MSKRYLIGSDVENDITRQKARLLGIAHECYVQQVQDKGTTYIQDHYGTMYGARLIQKKVAIVDNILVFSETEFCLEFSDVESPTEDYAKLPNVHKNKTKTAEQMNSEEWEMI